MKKMGKNLGLINELESKRVFNVDRRAKNLFLGMDLSSAAVIRGSNLSKFVLGLNCLPRLTLKSCFNNFGTPGIYFSKRSRSLRACAKFFCVNLNGILCYFGKTVKKVILNLAEESFFGVKKLFYSFSI